MGSPWDILEDHGNGSIVVEIGARQRNVLKHRTDRSAVVFWREVEVGDALQGPRAIVSVRYVVGPNPVMRHGDDVVVGRIERQSAKPDALDLSIVTVDLYPITGAIGPFDDGQRFLQSGC